MWLFFLHQQGGDGGSLMLSGGEATGSHLDSGWGLGLFKGTGGKNSVSVSVRVCVCYGYVSINWGPPGSQKLCWIHKGKATRGLIPVPWLHHSLSWPSCIWTYKVKGETSTLTMTQVQFHGFGSLQCWRSLTSVPLVLSPWSGHQQLAYMRGPDQIKYIKQRKMRKKEREKCEENGP